MTSRPRRLGLSVLAATVLAATTVVGPGGSFEASAASCGPAPAGRVAVAVVVDGGTTPSTRCVEVPERSTGYDVLVAAGHTLRVESGFLCAIDGVPATGCGNRPDFAGAYWRYFHAPPGGSWVYSTVGGGGYRVPARCAVEGWRWSDAPAATTTPRVMPPAVTCEAPPPSPTPPVAQATPPTTAARPAPTAPAERPAVTPQAPQGPPESAPGIGSGVGGGVGQVEQDEPSAAGPDADAGTEVGTESFETAAPPDDGDEQPAVPAEESDSGRDEPDDAAPAAVRSGSVDGGGSGGSPLGVLVGIGAILALGIGAGVRAARRRTGAEVGLGTDRAEVHGEI